MKKIIDKIKRRLASRNQRAYIKYLREKGVKIGNNCQFRSLKTTRIDLTRPSLVEIGDNVDMNYNFQILTHDWASSVFRNYYHELIPSSGKVEIGNNIYFGTNVIVLKNVTIGDNCVIAAGYIINRDIPANSVVAGVPAKVICSLDEFFIKRKVACIEESFVYARSIKERFNRIPTIADFWEEFPLFMEGKDVDYSNQLVIEQLGGMENFKIWKKQHKSSFNNFEDFLKAAGLK